MFTGETMVCHKCGFSFKSRNSLESMFTAVAVDEKELFYFCPHCWGIPRKHWPTEVKKAYDEWSKTNGK
jgi:predicted RNA-binding Zn-ribbon protein involved in translation (DUF1610 family)